MICAMRPIRTIDFVTENLIHVSSNEGSQIREAEKLEISGTG